MHSQHAPRRGTIGKHMTVGLQGKIPCQTTHLGSADYIEQVFKGTPLAYLTFFFQSVWVDVLGGTADLRSVSEENFYLCGKTALISQVLDQITIFMRHIMNEDISVKNLHLTIFVTIHKIF